MIWHFILFDTNGRNWYLIGEDREEFPWIQQ